MGYYSLLRHFIVSSVSLSFCFHVSLYLCLSPLSLSISLYLSLSLSISASPLFLSLSLPNLTLPNLEDDCCLLACWPACLISRLPAHPSLIRLLSHSNMSETQLLSDVHKGRYSSFMTLALGAIIFKSHTIKRNLLWARSHYLVVKADSLWPRGCGFKPQHHILDGCKRYC